MEQSITAREATLGAGVDVMLSATLRGTRGLFGLRFLPLDGRALLLREESTRIKHHPVSSGKPILIMSPDQRIRQRDETNMHAEHR